MSGTLLHDGICWKMTRIDSYTQKHKYTLKYLSYTVVAIPLPTQNSSSPLNHAKRASYNKPACTLRTTPTNTPLQGTVPPRQTPPATKTRLRPHGLHPVSSISFPIDLCPTYQLHTRQAKNGHTLPVRDGSRGGLINSHNLNRKWPPN
jgi:hypothetical protein